MIADAYTQTLTGTKDAVGTRRRQNQMKLTNNAGNQPSELAVGSDPANEMPSDPVVRINE